MQNRLLNAIRAQASALTKHEARIAAYLSARPEAIAVESGAALAEKIGVSPMTLTRFFRKLGFDSAAAARESVKDDLYGPRASRIASRFESYKASRTRSDDTDLSMAGIALGKAMALRRTDAWAEIVRLTAEADMVYVAGFQSMRYLADGLCQRLRYVRNNVTPLDTVDGVFGNMFTDQVSRKTLIMIDNFRYAAEGPLLLGTAAEAGIDVVFFCDEFCDWAKDQTPHVVVLPNESSFFMGMPVGLHFALNLLIQDVIAALGARVDGHMEILSRIQDALGQFL
ncbi:MAG: MurR/RpiR family transcriptional regulator [Alphaproteobacteria bacterium]|nr:MurR/RpiR family transcriptional regulator [Alphaproteobacteria bacterium]